MFKAFFTIFIFIFTTTSSSKETSPFQHTNPEKRILIKRDYEKGLEYRKNISSKKEEERKEKLQAVIKDIEDSGFEVNQENKIISAINLDLENIKNTPCGYFYKYEFIDFEKLEELNKYSSEFRLRIKNPVGLDFIIKHEKLENGMITSEEDPYITLENGEDIPNSSGFSFASGYLNIYIQVLKNDYMEDLIYEYTTTNKKGQLKIDLDQETGKKIFYQEIPAESFRNIIKKGK